MRVDLSELLRIRKIVHPARITSAALSERSLRVVVRGYPWWRDEADWTCEETITFTFQGVAGDGGGWLDLHTLADPDHDEALELFDVSPLASHDWGQPSTFAIYGSAPLPDPLAFYTKIEDHLWRARACRDARDFLNTGSGLLSGFIGITTTTSYLVARGPESIRQLVCDELQRQSVPHNVLPERGRADDALLVHLGGSSFLCGAAFAEFGEG